MLLLIHDYLLLLNVTCYKCLRFLKRLPAEHSKNVKAFSVANRNIQLAVYHGISNNISVWDNTMVTPFILLFVPIYYIFVLDYIIGFQGLKLSFFPWYQFFKIWITATFAFGGYLLFKTTCSCHNLVTFSENVNKRLNSSRICNYIKQYKRERIVFSCYYNCLYSFYLLFYRLLFCFI